jgi:hypothetical protein
MSIAKRKKYKCAQLWKQIKLEKNTHKDIPTI